MNNKVIIGFCVFAVLFFAANIAWSHDYHRTTKVIEKVTDKTIINPAGVALAIAKAQHQMDWSTVKWQGSVGMGSFDNNDAISFADGKRVGQILLNISVGRENGKYGYGAGATWRF
jgi:hypothetical protein